MGEKKVLALDLGPTSIGWAFINEAAGQIIATGVRIFPEGVDRDKQGGEKSKNESRRQARGIRRQIARRARRKRVLRAALVEAGLLPPLAAHPAQDPTRREWESAEFKKADPYELRRRTLSEKLELFDIGRVFLHLAQRRGFLSNRKADRAKKAEASEILTEISDLANAMASAGNKTLGEHFAKSLEIDPHQSVRRKHTRRQMYLDEFDAIWEAQRKYYPTILTDALKYGTNGRVNYPQKPVQTGGGPKRLLAKFGIHGLIFFQRPMFWPKSVVGRCELDPKQKRCARADRSAQEFRLLVEANNLRIIGSDGEVRCLTEEQREKLLSLMNSKKEVKFDEIRKKLGLFENDGFNLEAGERKKLDGNKTDSILADKKLFGKAWFNRTNDERDKIVRSMIHDDEPTFLSTMEEIGVEQELAERLLDVSLPDGYSSYGRKTIELLLPHLRCGLPLTSREGPSALREAGFLAPWERPVIGGQYLPPPPKLTNPIVRQALFEVRKLLNALIREYGKPDAIHIELAREVKGTGAQRAQRTKDMRERERRRADAAKIIAEELGEKPTHNKINRYLLWQEQSELCMYSGRPISAAQLFGGEIDTDHILPYSQSLDDSLMNKVLCFRTENADKGQRTVHSWLAGANDKKYEQVLQRAARLPIEIRNRKLPRFSQKTCELTDFINRHFTDTAYITSMVLAYLQNLGVELLGSKGQLTAELRHQWGLNTVLRNDGLNLKSREDHRHHAVDAVVIAVTSRTRLQQLAKNRGDASLPPPWPTFREDVEKAINAINVSHRVRRKLAGALHEETIYGATQKKSGGSKLGRPWAKNWTEETGTYCLRKPLEALSLNEVEKIRDDRVRELVQDRLRQFGLMGGRKKKVKGAGDDDKGASRNISKEVWKEPLYLLPRDGKSGGTPTIIRKVRLTKREESIVPLRTGGKAFVKPGSLHHVAIFEVYDGKGKARREAVFVSMLEAARRIREKLPVIQRKHPSFADARFIMTLSRGELVQGEFKGVARLVRFVTAASTQGQIYFADHTDARPSGAIEKFATMSNTLKGRKVVVDLLGRLYPAND